MAYNNNSEVYIEPASKSPLYPKSNLGVALKIIGIVNVVIGFILGFKLCGSHGLLSDGYDANILGILFFILSGIIGCIICFALAITVDASLIYLDSISKGNK